MLTVTRDMDREMNRLVFRIHIGQIYGFTKAEVESWQDWNLWKTAQKNRSQLGSQLIRVACFPYQICARHTVSKTSGCLSGLGHLIKEFTILSQVQERLRNAANPLWNKSAGNFLEPCHHQCQYYLSTLLVAGVGVKGWIEAALEVIQRQRSFL